MIRWRISEHRSSILAIVGRHTGSYLVCLIYSRCGSLATNLVGQLIGESNIRQIGQSNLGNHLSASKPFETLKLPNQNIATLCVLNGTKQLIKSMFWFQNACSLLLFFLWKWKSIFLDSLLIYHEAVCVVFFLLTFKVKANCQVLKRKNKFYCQLV